LAAAPPSPPVTQEQNGPVGVGGWLILPILSLVVTLILTAINLAKTPWDGVTAIFLNGRPELAPLRLPVLCSLVGAVLLIGGSVFALVQIYRCSPRVPKIMTVFYVAAIFLTIGEAIADAAISSATGSLPDPIHIRDIVGAVIRAAIWIPYFHKSRRVANTFKIQETTTNARLDEVFS